MSHEYRMEQLRAAIAAARKNFKKDANFFVVGLTYGCRRPCNTICSNSGCSALHRRYHFVSSSGAMGRPSGSRNSCPQLLYFSGAFCSSYLSFLSHARSSAFRGLVIYRMRLDFLVFGFFRMREDLLPSRLSGKVW